MEARFSYGACPPTNKQPLKEEKHIRDAVEEKRVQDRNRPERTVTAESSPRPRRLHALPGAERLASLSLGEDKCRGRPRRGDQLGARRVNVKLENLDANFIKAVGREKGPPSRDVKRTFPDGDRSADLQISAPL